MARPRQHTDELRTRLLDDAATVVGIHGAPALTLRRLAQASGTSTSAVYSLFGGKPEVFAALHRSAFGDFGDAQRSVPTTADPAADLLALAHSYRDWALAHPHWYAVMFSGSVDAYLPADMDLEHCTAAISPLHAGVHRFLATAAARPGLDPDLVATSLWSAVHGFVSLELLQLLEPVARDGRAAFEACATAALTGWSVAVAPVR